METIIYDVSGFMINLVVMMMMCVHLVQVFGYSRRRDGSLHSASLLLSIFTILSISVCLCHDEEINLNVAVDG